MKKKYIILVIAVLVIVSLIIGISLFSVIFAPSLSELSGAENHVKMFYSRLNNEDYGGVFELYTNDSFSSQDEKNETLAFFKEINEKLGAVEDFSMYYFRVWTYEFGDWYSNIILIYKVERTYHDSEETFTISTLQGSNDYYILDYTVSSDGLVE